MVSPVAGQGFARRSAARADELRRKRPLAASGRGCLILFQQSPAKLDGSLDAIRMVNLRVDQNHLPQRQYSVEHLTPGDRIVEGGNPMLVVDVKRSKTLARNQIEVREKSLWSGSHMRVFAAASGALPALYRPNRPAISGWLRGSFPVRKSLRVSKLPCNPVFSAGIHTRCIRHRARTPIRPCSILCGHLHWTLRPI